MFRKVKTQSESLEDEVDAAEQVGPSSTATTWTLPLQNGAVDVKSAEYVEQRRSCKEALRSIVEARRMDLQKEDLQSVLANIKAPTRGDVATFLFNVSADVKRELAKSPEQAGVAFYQEVVVKLAVRELSVSSVAKPTVEEFVQRCDQAIMSCVNVVVQQGASAIGGMQPLDAQVKLIKENVPTNLLSRLRQAIKDEMGRYF